jgi:DivIVA domain-containing protein
MTIPSTMLTDHRFPRAFRGYATAEVDAVMESVKAALSANEAEIASLRSSLEEARAQSDTIQRTLISAQRTRDEMLADAKEQSDAARKEAERITQEARSDAERLIHDAEARSAAIDADAEAARQQSLEEAEAEAATVADGAAEERDRMIASAQAEAAAIVGDARREADELIERIPVLRAAIHAVEQELRSLSRVGLERSDQAARLLEAAADEAGDTATARGAPLPKPAETAADADVPVAGAAPLIEEIDASGEPDAEAETADARAPVALAAVAAAAAGDGVADLEPSPEPAIGAADEGGDEATVVDEDSEEFEDGEVADVIPMKAPPEPPDTFEIAAFAGPDEEPQGDLSPLPHEREAGADGSAQPA